MSVHFGEGSGTSGRDLPAAEERLAGVFEMTHPREVRGVADPPVKGATATRPEGQTRGVTSLKYAIVERERRWLLDGMPPVPDDASRVRIVDRYLPGTRLRLRATTGVDGTTVRKLGHKVRLGHGAREVAHT